VRGGKLRINLKGAPQFSFGGGEIALILKSDPLLEMTFGFL
jgi:hypothetical protein